MLKGQMHNINVLISDCEALPGKRKEKEKEDFSRKEKNMGLAK